MSLNKLKVRKIEVNGDLVFGVYVKDVIFYIICKLGVKGGVGYVYEYVGLIFVVMNMEECMIVCNMFIEGGVCCGYINLDEVIFVYFKGWEFVF